MSRLSDYIASRSEQAVGKAVILGVSVPLLVVGLAVELGLGGFLIGLGVSGLAVLLGEALERR